jgi:CHAT domain-containing protein
MKTKEYALGTRRRCARRAHRIRRSDRQAIAALAFCAAWPLFASSQPVELAEGRTASATHGADERFVYAATLHAGGNYLIRLDQQGLDLILTVEPPSGAPLVGNSPLFRDGSEYVLVENAQAGVYHFGVDSEETTSVTGGHALVWNALTVTAPELDAWRAMTLGATANRRGGEAAWVDAAAAYEHAAALWRDLERPLLAAMADFAAAMIDYWQLYDSQAAAQRAAAAAQTLRQFGEAAIAANATHLQAAAIVEMALETQQSSSDSGISAAAQSQFDTALALLEEARSTQEQLGNIYDLGLITNNFGYTFYNMGRFEEARAAYQRAAGLLENLGEATAELNPRFNLAVLEVERGYLAAAIETFERTLEILPEGRLDEYRSAALNNLGAAHLAFGDAEQALQTFDAALELQTRIDDRQGRGRTLRDIGQTYYGLGELELAAQYLAQALPIARQTSDGRNQEASLRALGNVAFAQGDYAAALSYHQQALQTAASIFDRARLQILVAKDLRALGRGADALAAATEASRSADNFDSDHLRADASLELAEVYLAIEQADSNEHTGEAARHFNLARNIYAQIGLASSLAAVDHGLALLAAREGRLEDALAHGEASLMELERLRTRVADPELRAFLAGTRRDYYESQIEFHMALQATAGEDDDTHLRRALETSERARARLTADLLQEASIDLEAQVDPKFKQQERELYAALAEQSFQRGKLLQGSATAEQMSAVVATMSGLENRLNLLEIQMRRSSPSFASLGHAQTLTVADIQAALDADTVLLQYALGQPASYAWIVTQSSIEVVRLADKDTIETAARALIDELNVYTGTPRSPQSMQRLADLVLTPVASRLDAPRVVLALDGALQYVPMAVLPVNASATLLSDHEVVEIPSMSAIAALRKRESPGTAAKTLAVFADPVVGRDDPRMDSVTPQFAAATLFTRSSWQGDLARLQSSAYEAESISGLVAQGDRLLASGFDASRSAVLDGDLESYRYIHFATHGLIDSRYPGLSALALSSFDALGQPRDGMLRLHDIYNLDLNADLVVLSACETALGREVRGEGLIGLTQGFMYAGARSVIASLWQVPDRATAELMTHFYSYLLEHDLNPAQALRRAQLDVAAARRWRDPYFWGGFVLLGDWR